MEKNSNNISFINKNDTFNENEKLKLPKIETEMTPLQKKFRLNKICQCEKKNNSRTKIINPAFLTSRKENEKINSYKSININRPNDKIYKLLKEKIEIKMLNKNRYQSNTHKNLKSNKLKSYIDEAKIYKNTKYEKSVKKKIKRINVGQLFTSSNISKINFFDNDDLDLRIYKNFNEKENYFKRLKTLDKKNIHDISCDFHKKWIKNLNCALKYRFNENRQFIDIIAKEIKHIDKKVKETFNEFHNETDDIFNEVLIVKENKRKRRFKQNI